MVVVVTWGGVGSFFSLGRGVSMRPGRSQPAKPGRRGEGGDGKIVAYGKSSLSEF